MWVLLGLSASIFFFANYYDKQTTLHLKQSSHYIATGLKQYGINYLLHVNTTYRISLIDSNGNVIYDNMVNPNSLDNHATRQEFQESMKHGIGQSYRYSPSTMQPMLYYAIKIMLSRDSFNISKDMGKDLSEHFANTKIATSQELEQPYILRIASQHKNIYALLYDFAPYICIGLIACIAMSYVLANAISSSIISPLNALRPDNPLALQSYKELSPLLHKIDEQNRLIQTQIKQLQAKQEEFSAITQNMEDGFLLLDSKGNILSFNKSSMRLFGALHEGMNIAMLHEKYAEWFRVALDGQRHTQTIEHNGCNYQVIIESVFEPIESLQTQNLDSINIIDKSSNNDILESKSSLDSKSNCNPTHTNNKKETSLDFREIDSEILLEQNLSHEKIKDYMQKTHNDCDIDSNNYEEKGNEELYKIHTDKLLQQANKSHNQNKNCLESCRNKNIESKPIGVAIIILDITEKAQREQLRREFSSNVSHELKTPLTSILGVIEMLQNNLIKQADIPKFLDNIHKEAKHLINLIEDIIILNELDHDYNFIPCPISMQNICHIAIDMLSDSMQQKQIQCDIKGSDFMVMGEQRLLIAMLFNLCENAIKYNRNHGSIDILLDSDKKSVCIKDNGIGIPTMYHERIFERFFCVDKSHSNMINGTGLGLSIVKHIAHLHNATIELESEIDIGTAISISFA